MSNNIFRDLNVELRSELRAMRAERDAIRAELARATDRCTAAEAERDALAARVAALEAVSRDALEAMQMADTRVIGLTGSEYRQWDRAATNLRAVLRGEGA